MALFLYGQYCFNWLKKHEVRLSAVVELPLVVLC